MEIINERTIWKNDRAKLVRIDRGPGKVSWEVRTPFYSVINVARKKRYKTLAEALESFLKTY